MRGSFIGPERALSFFLVFVLTIFCFSFFLLLPLLASPLLVVHHAMVMWIPVDDDMMDG